MNFTIVNKTVVLVAKRNSGKSRLLKYLVSEYKEDFQKIFVICPTEKINHFYQKDNFIPANCVFETYSEDWVEKLIEKMTATNSKKSDADCKNVLLIIDDVVADTNFHQSQSLKKLFIRSRHIKISVIITAQYLNMIPPCARVNADFVAVGQLNKQGFDILAEEYITAGLSKDEFTVLYKRNTKDYGFLLINNNSTKSDDINESYGMVKTPADFVEKNKN